MQRVISPDWNRYVLGSADTMVVLAHFHCQTLQSFLCMFLTVPYFSMRNSTPVRYTTIRKFQATCKYLFAEAQPLSPRCRVRLKEILRLFFASRRVRAYWTMNSITASLPSLCAIMCSRSGGGISGFGRESAGSQRFLWKSWGKKLWELHT